eukprot:TRINITY_DN2018_c0_g1_i1.p2 TRINITY_DN2018_c0_g1~~TRINITY_DN2018_c0_g1_i1.p2  ORF type:complete len:216 (+),score=25.35 TRINITY_DN2018_c0_g1_i1:1229-1876(+)
MHHVAAPAPDTLDAADAFLPCVRRRTSPIYMRDNNAEAKSLFDGVLSRVADESGGDKRPLRYELDAMLANSPAVLRKLETLLPQQAERLRQALEEAGAGAGAGVCAPLAPPACGYCVPTSALCRARAPRARRGSSCSRLCCTGSVPRHRSEAPAHPASAAGCTPARDCSFSSRPLECPHPCVRQPRRIRSLARGAEACACGSITRTPPRLPAHRR